MMRTFVFVYDMSLLYSGDFDVASFCGFVGAIACDPIIQAMCAQNGFMLGTLLI